MSVLLLYLPLLSALINGFGGTFLGHRGSTYLAPFLVGLTFLTACFLSWDVLLNEEVFYSSLGLCVNAFGYEIYWALQYDALTAVMILVVTSISWLVHIYATSYMSEDPHLSRFLACLSLFTFFMLVLVTADNYFQLFVGWEGVGLCSYLLINFWYTRIQANKAALQALVVNKVGDYFLALAVIFLLNILGTTTFSTVFHLVPFLQTLEIAIGPYTLSFLDVIGVAFLVAAMAKSAQIGLHTWLLSAMEGPTPVSALLHAATMVTAGVFLLLRSSWLLEATPVTLWLIAGVGAGTAFFAGTCGLVQHDLKKIIALSTCSQLGYMFYACGLSQYSLSLFHLTNHAFFKALLFLGAGAVIHALQGEQDLRRMGGLAKIMPVTYVAMSLASLALMGFPFLSGFYSKDRILESAWAHFSVIGHFNFWLTTAAAIGTAVYSWRLIYWVFLSDTQTFKSVIQRAHEADERMLWTFRALMVGSLMTGYILKDAFAGLGSDFLKESVALTVNAATIMMESEFVPLYIKVLPLIGSLSGAILALFFYHSPLYSDLVRWQMRNPVGYWLHFFLVKKWFWDRLYNYYIATGVYRAGGYLYTRVDQGYLEHVGPQGLSSLLSFAGRQTSLTFQWSAMVMISNFFGAIAFILLVFYGSVFNPFDAYCDNLMMFDNFKSNKLSISYLFFTFLIGILLGVILLGVVLRVLKQLFFFLALPYHNQPYLLQDMKAFSYYYRFLAEKCRHFFISLGISNSTCLLFTPSGFYHMLRTRINLFFFNTERVWNTWWTDYLNPRVSLIRMELENLSKFNYHEYTAEFTRKYLQDREVLINSLNNLNIKQLSRPLTVVEYIALTLVLPMLSIEDLEIYGKNDKILLDRINSKLNYFDRTLVPGQEGYSTVILEQIFYTTTYFREVFASISPIVVKRLYPVRAFFGTYYSLKELEYDFFKLSYNRAVMRQVLSYYAALLVFCINVCAKLSADLNVEQQYGGLDYYTLRYQEFLQRVNFRITGNSFFANLPVFKVYPILVITVFVMSFIIIYYMLEFYRNNASAEEFVGLLTLSGGGFFDNRYFNQMLKVVMKYFRPDVELELIKRSALSPIGKPPVYAKFLLDKKFTGKNIYAEYEFEAAKHRVNAQNIDQLIQGDIGVQKTWVTKTLEELYSIKGTVDPGVWYANVSGSFLQLKLLVDGLASSHRKLLDGVVELEASVSNMAFSSNDVDVSIIKNGLHGDSFKRLYTVCNLHLKTLTELPDLFLNLVSKGASKELTQSVLFAFMEYKLKNITVYKNTADVPITMKNPGQGDMSINLDNGVLVKAEAFNATSGNFNLQIFTNYTQLGTRGTFNFYGFKTYFNYGLSHYRDSATFKKGEHTFTCIDPKVLDAHVKDNLVSKAAAITFNDPSTKALVNVSEAVIVAAPPNVPVVTRQIGIHAKVFSSSKSSVGGGDTGVF